MTYRLWSGWSSRWKDQEYGSFVLQFMMLDISLGLDLCWSPREVYSNTSEGIHHHCQQQQQQSKSKQTKNFFMFFSVDCRQKV